jgi:subfamily B ATP-binding cassette protein MsbA
LQEKDNKQDQPKPSLRQLSILKPYVSLLRGQELDLFLTFFLMLISTGLALAIPLYAGRFVDAISTEGGLTNLLQDHVGLLIIMLLFQMLGGFFGTVIGARLGLRTVTRLRGRVYSHLLELPALFFSGQKAGDISSRVTGDVGAIRSILTGGLVSLVKAVITLIGALILMINLNPRLTVAVLLLIPATIILTQVFGGRLQKLSRTMYQELGKINSQVQETVTGIRSLKVYNAQTYESGRFQTMITDYEKAGMKRAWLEAGFQSGIQMSMWITLLSIVIYGFSLMNRGLTTSGELVAFLLLAMRVAMPMGSLTALFSSAQGAIAAAGRLDDLFGLKTERRPGAPSPKPDPEPASLELKNVTFTYPQTEEPVLWDLSVDIARGSSVAVVGPSGAGKTTLAGMLLGLFAPDQGQLKLDGKPFSEYDLSELRARMAWVAQEPMLYDMSLADNIRFGLDTATDEEVRQAAARAEVMEFAVAMPEGLETMCGEGGNRLSGGQKQRVALARAFLHNPGLLVLDEPTSALDAASEEAIRLGMRNLMQGRTVVVIAHRFSLVKDLDLILVMNQGRLVQQGSHDELIAQDGLYRTLYELQQGEPDESAG